MKGWKRFHTVKSKRVEPYHKHTPHTFSEPVPYTENKDLSNIGAKSKVLGLNIYKVITLSIYPHCFRWSLIRVFPDNATFRKKGAKLACVDKLGVSLSLFKNKTMSICHSSSRSPYNKTELGKNSMISFLFSDVCYTRMYACLHLKLLSNIGAKSKVLGLNMYKVITLLIFPHCFRWSSKCCKIFPAFLHEIQQDTNNRKTNRCSGDCRVYKMFIKLTILPS